MADGFVETVDESVELSWVADSFSITIWMAPDDDSGLVGER